MQDEKLKTVEEVCHGPVKPPIKTLITCNILVSTILRLAHTSLCDFSRRYLSFIFANARPSQTRPRKFTDIRIRKPRDLCAKAAHMIFTSFTCLPKVGRGVLRANKTESLKLNRYKNVQTKVMMFYPSVLAPSFGTIFYLLSDANYLPVWTKMSNLWFSSFDEKFHLKGEHL